MTDLQFEHAEFDAPATGVCAVCQAAISGLYWQIGDRMACERCKSDVEIGVASGSSIGRALRATLFGGLAGVVGAAIWYGVRAATGYEVGLIAIAVGMMVGAGVRKGSGGRGGWRYQVLAVCLTYASIASSYVPMVFSELMSAHRAEAGKAEAASTVAGATPDLNGAVAGAAVEGAPAPDSITLPDTPAPATSEADADAPGSGQALLAVGVLVAVVFAFALAAPFLGGFENIIGIAIIAFGLYEAWKMNRHVPMEISGPFRIGAVPPGADPTESR